MSLESIVARIHEDSEREAAEIRNRAAMESRSSEEEYGREIEAQYNRELERLKSRMLDLRKRKEFHVRMDVSRRVMNARRSLMDQAISGAVRNLANLDKEEYLELVGTLLEGCHLKGEISVVISPSDEKRITKAYLKNMSSNERKFVLSEERHSGTGGVILRSGMISQNATFSMIADLAHEEMVMKLASTIPLEGEE